MTDDPDLITEEEVRRWAEEDEAAERARLPIGTRVRWPAYPNLGICIVKHSYSRLAFICREDQPDCVEPIAVAHAELMRVE